MAGKRQEAEDEIKKAEAALKTGFFKSKPDYDTAGVHYDRAAVCYKNCHDKKMAISTYERLADVHKNMDTYNSAGKALENAAALADDATKKSAFLAAASGHYRMGDAADRAAEALIKAAKAIELKDEKAAAKYALDACQVYEDEDRLMFAKDTFQTALALVLRQKDLPQAIDILKRQATMFTVMDSVQNIHKCHLSVIVLHLAMPDSFAAAEQAFNEYSADKDFNASEEWLAAGELLDAIGAASEERLQAALEGPALMYIDNAVARIAKQIKIVDGPQRRIQQISLDDDNAGVGAVEDAGIEDDDDLL